jgi:hypothetical protein
VEKKKYRYGGEVRSKKLLREKEKPPATVYEVRGHPGWNHHMLICMLARFFLRHLKIRLGEKSSIYYSVPGADPAGGCSAA